MFKKYKLRNYNFMLLILVIAAMIVGVVAINAADSSYTQKQAIGVVGAVFIMVFISFIDYH